ncbi:MAG TPA: septum formation protein Maf [Firmicutes bacterium]|jgi:septum formation protein|nr:septum formation protein Maf [Bacillota bacterium]
MRELILASASPRRSELLRQIGWQHQVRPSNFREATAATDPQSFVLYNALGKAREVAEHYTSGIILGADTVVVHAGALMGKPKGKAEAADMLRALSDDWHDVFTAVALIDCASGREVSDVVRTRVHMRTITPVELDWYLSTDEPYDKAGAYGIQGRAAIFVDQIDGCYFNVVGLPLSKLAELRQQLEAVGC